MKPVPRPGIRCLRVLLLVLLLGLAAVATGCDEIMADILTGDGCGSHDVCSRKAAAAGTGAAVVGAAGAYLQRIEDSSESPLPWDQDEAEWEAEFDNALSDKTVIRDESAPWDDPGELDLDEDIEDILGPEEKSGEPGTGTATKEPPGTSHTHDSKPDVEREGGYPEEPDESAKGELDAQADASDEGKGGDKAETGEKKPTVGTEKPKSPAAPYVPVATLGDVTILVDPDTGKVAVSNGTYIGGKDRNGYWITDNDQVVSYNNETGEASISNGQFTAEKDGTTYTLTDDGKVLSYDKEGHLKVSDGHFAATRDQETFAVTKDNKVISYDHMTGDMKITDGHFTATRESDVYTVTKDNKILHFNKNNGDIVISDGHFTAVRENDVYTIGKDNTILHFNKNNGDIAVTDGHFTAVRENDIYTVAKDNTILHFNKNNGDIAVTDGQFTATRENDVYSLTQDNKVLHFNRNNGDFKVSDGHFVAEREGSTTVFTKDNLKIEYDKDVQGVMVTTTGDKGTVAVGAGRDGQWAAAANIEGSIDGTPTDFGAAMIKYNLPETGEQGFAAGVNLDQEDFGVSAQFIKESDEQAFNATVRQDEWTLGYQKIQTSGPQGGDEAKTISLGWKNDQFSVAFKKNDFSGPELGKYGDTKTYEVGLGKFKINHERGLGDNVTTTGYTRRF